MSVSTHSRAETAACLKISSNRSSVIASTHSRPKAAAIKDGLELFFAAKFQHTAARRRLLVHHMIMCVGHWFQHTAARRRLLDVARQVIDRLSFNTQPPEGGCKAIVKSMSGGAVSTHSRPKAAAGIGYFTPALFIGFNTQPPEGGCFYNNFRAY